LWAQPWVAPTFPVNKRIPLTKLRPTAFKEATKGYDAEKFELCRSDVRELAQEFLNILGEAAERQDFTNVLSPQHEFIIVRWSASGGERIQSLGEGIKCEVLQTAFQEFQDQSTSMPCTERSTKLNILGTLTSLLLLNSIPPIPLSPVLLHYFIHDSDLNSITSDLLGNWYPDLAKLIKDWINAGSSGDIQPFASHFMTYHDTQACSMNSPIIQTFRHFCKAFSYHVFIKHVKGGSEFLTNILWASNITSFADLLRYLCVRSSSSSVVHQLAVVVPDPSMTFLFIISQFLEGTGVPCPALFEDARYHFTADLVDLSNMEAASFWSKILTWATTGSPSINANDDSGISITLVPNNNPLYCSTECDRPAMLANGKICFKTCLKEARVPLSWLVKLAGISYSTNMEPSSFSAAVHHWLLCECLNEIGSHSILWRSNPACLWF
ncbi:hypothetical protein L208DRAFT_1334555, partial [Tricholoma matsutake]